MAMNPQEIATLEVRGKLFTDWKSVQVKQEWTRYNPIFTFEATEASPIPVRFGDLPFQPGDEVRVHLGSYMAVRGYIQERHVGFDARNHGVRLVGVGRSFDVTNSSVPLNRLGNHDGKTWMQLAKALTEHLGIGVDSVGAVDNTPIENVQVQPGETIAQTLERYARMRKIIIGSTADGNLLAIGDHAGTSSGELREGDNILQANAVLRDEYLFQKIFAIGQQNSNDQRSGDQSNKQIAQVSGSSTRNRHLVVVADIADSQHGINQRAAIEKLFTEGAKLEAHIRVQGWFKPGGNDPWRAGEYYTVVSPMLGLNNLLGCRSALYEQADGSGTTTTLEMVDPFHMNGRPNLG